MFPGTKHPLSSTHVVIQDGCPLLIFAIMIESMISGVSRWSALFTCVALPSVKVSLKEVIPLPPEQLIWRALSVALVFSKVVFDGVSGFDVLMPGAACGWAVGGDDEGMTSTLFALHGAGLSVTIFAHRGRWIYRMAVGW